MVQKRQDLVTGAAAYTYNGVPFTQPYTVSPSGRVTASTRTQIDTSASACPPSMTSSAQFCDFDNAGVPTPLKLTTYTTMLTQSLSLSAVLVAPIVQVDYVASSRTSTTAARITSSSSRKSSRRKKLSTGAITGIGVGIAVLIIVIAIVIFIILERRKNNKRGSPTNERSVTVHKYEKVEDHPEEQGTQLASIRMYSK